MANIYNNILELVGKTPIVKLNKINESDAEVLAKIESFNPGRAVKDRISLAMIEQAEKDGLLDKDTVIIEPTSGNTGIGLAFVAAVKGYRLILTMPESMSLERRSLLKAYGAELVLTPATGGMKGAINKATELADEYEKSFIPQQFNNAANPNIHKNTTAQEILADTDGNVDIFVAGVGTGGTISGVGEILKAHNKNVKIVAVEPVTSAVISGEAPGSHKIQGIGAGFIPKNLNVDIIDEVFKVSDDQAINTMKELSHKDGILAGISSGAATYAALEIAKRPENKGKRIVVLLPDTGERYLSMNLF